MKRLFIAEKPSLGKAIADGLGKTKVNNGYIQCGEDVVTWAFGHLYELANPEEYIEGGWKIENLPIFPKEWKRNAKKDAKKQLKIIEKLLKEADIVVNAGDPDREGQLLIDEILEELGWKKKTQRILLSSLDKKSVNKALSNLRDNKEFEKMRFAAEARARADWLVGMNLTRAYTIVNKGAGVLSIGRVQTPVLSLIVNRDRKIKDFKSKDFYDVILDVAFNAKLKTEKVDEEGRLVDKAFAESVVEKVKSSGFAIVKKYSKTKKQQKHPLGLSLSELQKQCSSKFGMSAKKVLDIAQVLYEKHKVTTYPRSDCRYLPEEQFENAASILRNFNYDVDLNIKSEIWNTNKVTAHHAIIPTGVISNLNEDEQKVFNLIVKYYVAQFYKVQEYNEIHVELEVGGEKFVANGKQVIEIGWKAVFGKEDSNSFIPEIKEGMKLEIKDVFVETKKTTPPPRFNEGKLIDAMANIHRYVEDEEMKKKLMESKGIGTEATRAGIIEKLKERGFIEVKGKSIISTEKGRDLIDIVSKTISDPVTTARWENLLTKIEEGAITIEQFEEAQKKFVLQLIEEAKNKRMRMRCESST